MKKWQKIVGKRFQVSGHYEVKIEWRGGYKLASVTDMTLIDAYRGDGRRSRGAGNRIYDIVSKTGKYSRY